MSRIENTNMDKRRYNRPMRQKKQKSKMKKFFSFLIFPLFVYLQIVTEMSCMDTLLPVCIPWMYYQYVVLGTFLLPFIVTPIIRYFRKTSRKKKSISESYVWIIFVASIIIPAIIFLPNRHISLGTGTECQGVVIDQTSAAVNKSPSSNRNYVKIRIDGENTSFWHGLNKESKPLGSKCIVSVKRGIFGMRYVEEVDFLVE